MIHASNGGVEEEEIGVLALAIAKRREMRPFLYRRKSKWLCNNRRDSAQRVPDCWQ